jgi:D-ribose pyranose/furanose isomerase RbsD
MGILLHTQSLSDVTVPIASITTTIFLLLQNGTNSFMKVKIIDHQDLYVAEKQINEFLKKVEVKELVDIKFGTRFKNDTEWHTFVILYEENMAAGVEDPQIYE